MLSFLKTLLLVWELASDVVWIWVYGVNPDGLNRAVEPTWLLFGGEGNLALNSFTQAPGWAPQPSYPHRICC